MPPVTEGGPWVCRQMVEVLRSNLHFYRFVLHWMREMLWTEKLQKRNKILMSVFGCVVSIISPTPLIVCFSLIFFTSFLSPSSACLAARVLHHCVIFLDFTLHNRRVECFHGNSRVLNSFLLKLTFVFAIAACLPLLCLQSGRHLWWTLNHNINQYQGF